MRPEKTSAKQLKLLALVGDGVPVNKAAAMLGVSTTTARRWVDGSGQGDCARPASDARVGRKISVDLTPAEVVILRRAMLIRNSLPLAVDDLLASNDCTPATRKALAAILDKARLERKRPSFPPALRRAARVTGEMKALFRGGKKVESFTLLRPRGDYIIDPVGERVELAPNVLWESDDMSVNNPFRWIDPDTGEWQTGRQTLITGDRYSRAFLGVTPIGRSRDAYRVEDIADHILHCVETHGLPYIWRIERGVWDNQFIFGIKTKSGKTWGGLCDLIHIEQTWTSGGKGFIEGSFNKLQARLAHESLDIGRVRGEFEYAAKIMRQAQKGNEKALAHLWTIEECAEGMVAAMKAANAEQKTMRAQGEARLAPVELYGDFVPRKLEARDRWMFCPVKKELTVRRGIVSCKATHYPHPFHFQINGVEDGLYIEQGTPVLVAFHPGRPEEGAWIFNGMETSDVRNHHRIPWGARLLKAPLLELSPQVNLDPLAERDGRKAAATAAMRSEFRGLIPNGQHPSMLKKYSESRDKLGQALRVKVGGEEVQSEYLPQAPAPTKKKTYKLKKNVSLDAAKKALGL